MGKTDIRYYVVLNATRDVQERYYVGDKSWISTYIASHLFKGEHITPPFAVTAMPSNQVRSGLTDFEPDERRPIEELVVAISVDDLASLSKIANGVNEDKTVFLGGGPDLPFAGTDHWCPTATDPSFATRAAAEQLMGVNYLRGKNGANGRAVNVVVVDQGLNAAQLGSHYGGGWSVGSIMPGTTAPPPYATHRTHAMMIAHSVSKIAPDVTFFDLPLVPWKISDIQVFLSVADAAFRRMLRDIAKYRKDPKQAGPWILVNPWAIFDRKSECPPGSYTNNPTNPFNLLVAGAVKDGMDVVFPAGNCGQFCPDMRCGGRDQGPGQSIFGANCLPEVLTLGAVRVDTMWLGYSSQGPGQPRLAHEKPDLCTPSQFCETDDASSMNTGTSTACAMAAGVVAALRGAWDPARVPPAVLKQILIDTARKTDGPEWNGRTGHGILDAKRTFDELMRRYPIPPSSRRSARRHH